MHRYIYDTQIGKILIEENNDAITRVSMHLDDSNYDTLSDFTETPLLHAAYTELNEYLCGKRKVFSVPLRPEGTEFQKKVWNALCEIPYGETKNYGEVASKIGNKKAQRAVGMANHKNPIMIFIPCHRVIGANGKLTGYAAGIFLKERLLTLEKSGMKMKL